MADIKVQVCLYGFDLLYLNGQVRSFGGKILQFTSILPFCRMQSLVREPFRKRRELLHSAFVEVDDEFKFARYSDASTTDVSCSKCQVLASSLKFIDASLSVLSGNSGVFT